MPPVTSPVDSVVSNDISSPYGTPLPASVLGADSPPMHGHQHPINTKVGVDDIVRKDYVYVKGGGVGGGAKKMPPSPSNTKTVSGGAGGVVKKGISIHNGDAQPITATNDITYEQRRRYGTAAAAAAGGAMVATSTATSTAAAGASATAPAAGGLAATIAEIRSTVGVAWIAVQKLHFLWKLGLLAVLWKPILAAVRYFVGDQLPLWAQWLIGVPPSNSDGSNGSSTKLIGDRTVRTGDGTVPVTYSRRNDGGGEGGSGSSCASTLPFASLWSRAFSKADASTGRATTTRSQHHPKPTAVVDEDGVDDSEYRKPLDMLFWAP